MSRFFFPLPLAAYSANARSSETFTFAVQIPSLSSSLSWMTFGSSFWIFAIDVENT